MSSLSLSPAERVALRPVSLGGRQLRSRLFAPPRPIGGAKFPALPRRWRPAGGNRNAWVINGSLAAAEPRDPVLRARAAAEIAGIRTVKEKLAKRVALIPFQAEELVGVERLGSLAAAQDKSSRIRGAPVGAP